MDTLHVTQKNSRPNHPTTCGKIERFHQTLKRWLAAQPPAATIPMLQTQLDAFVESYNQRRPHTSIGGRTPNAAYHARPKATPTGSHQAHYRVRRDKVHGGAISLRVNAVMHHIGIGRRYHGTPVIMLINDLNVRVIHATTGETIGTVTINPNRRYHPTTPPKTITTEP